MLAEKPPKLSDHRQTRAPPHMHTHRRGTSTWTPHLPFYTLTCTETWPLPVKCARPENQLFPSNSQLTETCLQTENNSSSEEKHLPPGEKGPLPREGHSEETPSLPPYRKVCVCVCEREREREREKVLVWVCLLANQKNMYLVPGRTSSWSLCLCVSVSLCVCVSLSHSSRTASFLLTNMMHHLKNQHFITVRSFLKSLCF